MQSIPPPLPLLSPSSLTLPPPHSLSPLLSPLQVQQVTMQMRAAEETASQAEEMLETEQVEKRGLEEQLTEMTVSVSCVYVS